MEFPLRLTQGNVALQRLGRGHKFANQIRRGVNKYAGWLSADQFDTPTWRRFCCRIYASDFHRATVCPAGMAIDPLKPDGTVADGGVKVLGRWKAAKAPFFLIPTATNNPAAFGIFCGIGLDRRLCLRKAVGGGKVKRQQLEAKAHDMAMRINQTR